MHVNGSRGVHASVPFIDIPSLYLEHVSVPPSPSSSPSPSLGKKVGTTHQCSAFLLFLGGVPYITAYYILDTDVYSYTYRPQYICVQPYFVYIQVYIYIYINKYT